MGGNKRFLFLFFLLLHPRGPISHVTRSQGGMFLFVRPTIGNNNMSQRVQVHIIRRLCAFQHDSGARRFSVLCAFHLRRISDYRNAPPNHRRKVGRCRVAIFRVKGFAMMFRELYHGKITMRTSSTCANEEGRFRGPIGRTRSHPRSKSSPCFLPYRTFPFRRFRKHFGFCVFRERIADRFVPRRRYSFLRGLSRVAKANFFLARGHRFILGGQVISCLSLRFVSSYCGKFLGFTSVVLSLFVLSIYGSSNKPPRVFLRTPIARVFPYRGRHATDGGSLGHRVSPRGRRSRTSRKPVDSTRTQCVRSVMAVPYDRRGRVHHR